MYVSQGNGGNFRPHVSFCQNRLVPAEVYPESADQQIAVRYTHTVIVEADRCLHNQSDLILAILATTSAPLSRHPVESRTMLAKLTIAVL